MSLNAVELATYREAYQLYAQGFHPFDQTEKLGPEPWDATDPHVRRWEAVHGHDLRLKCYPEYGCQVTAWEFSELIVSMAAALVASCQECGDDEPTEGHIYCSDCLAEGALD